MALGTPSWLNLDFTEGMLRRSLGDNSIQVIDIFTKPATDKGDNYTSDMFRTTVEFSRNKGDKKIVEKKSLIFKMAPIAEGIRQDLIMRSPLFDTEISMMTNTLKKMNELLGPGNRLNGDALYVQSEHPKFLVIEDLAPLGYRMADRQAGLDLQHCILAIRGLAKFHAASVALVEKDPEHPKLYAKGMFSHDNPAEISSFFSGGTNALGTEVENWPELGKRYADKIKALAPHVFDKGVEVIKFNADEFNVIIHGDFWVNNMLFRYDDNGQPCDHIFVDFQLCLYTSPAIDLLYFLNTSPSVEVLENSKETILQEYLRTLSSTMKRLNCKTPAPTMDDLKKAMKKRAMYGMIASFTVLPLVLLDKRDAQGIDDILHENGDYNNPAYKSKLYRNVMEKRIPMFDKMGLLEI